MRTLAQEKKPQHVEGIQFLAAVIILHGYIHCTLIRMLHAYKLRNLILTRDNHSMFSTSVLENRAPDCVLLEERTRPI